MLREYPTKNQNRKRERLGIINAYALTLIISNCDPNIFVV